MVSSPGRSLVEFSMHGFGRIHATDHAMNHVMLWENKNDPAPGTNDFAR